MKTPSLPFGAKRCLSFRFYCSALKSFLLWWWCLWCQRFPGRRKRHQSFLSIQVVPAKPL